MVWLAVNTTAIKYLDEQLGLCQNKCTPPPKKQLVTEIFIPYSKERPIFYAQLTIPPPHKME